MQADKLPPQAHEVEESLLSSCINYPDDLERAVDILSPSEFYKGVHQTIFDTLKRLCDKNEPVDLPTITTALRDSGKLEAIGGAASLAALIEIPVSTNIEHSCSIIREKATLRKLIQISHKSIKDCYSCPSEAVENAQRSILEIDGTGHGGLIVPCRELVIDATDRYEHLQERQGDVTGIRSGFYNLDQLIAGFQRSDLIVLAARPSMGKTAFALNVIANLGREEKAALVFSLEMSKHQVIDRIIAVESRVNGPKFRTGRFSAEDWKAIMGACGRIYDWPIYVDETSCLSYGEIVRRARKAKRDHSIEMVVVDYLQYVSGDPGQGKNLEIQSITRALKGLAKDLDIPVLLLSQLNRKCEERPHPYKRPQLSDLRDSGAVEQDADLVLFLYRPEHYGEKDEKGREQPGIAEIGVAKHRNGPLGRLRLRWCDKVMRFENLKDKS